MRLLENTGSDRVVDELRQCLTPQGGLDIATPALSLFAFGELHDHLSSLARCRLVLPGARGVDLALLGGDSDRAYRNRLRSRWLARECSRWLDAKVEVRNAAGAISQSTLSITNGTDTVLNFFAGSSSTGHAVMKVIVAQRSSRRYILVQLPEPTGRSL